MFLGFAPCFLTNFTRALPLSRPYAVPLPQRGSHGSHKELCRAGKESRVVLDRVVLEATDMQQKDGQQRSYMWLHNLHGWWDMEHYGTIL